MTAPTHAVTMTTLARKPAQAQPFDGTTLALAQAGDATACRKLVERTHRPVYSLLWRMMESRFSRSDIEDLTQETFIRVFRALPGFDPDGPAKLQTWILTIATRLALNELRRKPMSMVPLAGARNAIAPDRSDATVERRETAEAIRAAVTQLKPNFRAVLILREYHGLSYDEIAEATDCDVNTVKSRLSRARAMARAALQGDTDDRK